MVQHELSCYNCISYSTLDDSPRTLPLPWSHYYLSLKFDLQNSLVDKWMMIRDVIEPELSILSCCPRIMEISCFGNRSHVEIALRET